MPDSNNTLLSWNVPEYRKHRRSKRWYLIAGAIFVLMLAYAVLSDNFLFTIILIVVAFTYVMQERKKPRNVLFNIGENGIEVGQKRYEYSSFKNFWIYYEPDETKMLFFEFKNSVRPRLGIPLYNKNPLNVRSVLLRFLPEDVEKENEPLSEQLTRLFKL